MDKNRVQEKRKFDQHCDNTVNVDFSDIVEVSAVEQNDIDFHFHPYLALILTKRSSFSVKF